MYCESDKDSISGFIPIRSGLLVRQPISFTKFYTLLPLMRIKNA